VRFADLNIGVFGGTFNPVHSGHTAAASHVLNELKLDRVLFVPVKNPVHKKLDGNATPLDRLAMLQLAVEDVPFFEADPIELEREGPSYTVHTLAALKERHPESVLYFMLGADSFNELDSWFDYEGILSLALIVVIRREGDELLRTDLIHRIPGLVQVNNDFINISSSLVRSRLREGLSVEGLVPGAVAMYIKNKGLYTQ
jgi:nicotinate-nucleotide adenylyltransferase